MPTQEKLQSLVGRLGQAFDSFTSLECVVASISLDAVEDTYQVLATMVSNCRQVKRLNILCGQINFAPGNMILQGQLFLEELTLLRPSYSGQSFMPAITELQRLSTLTLARLPTLDLNEAELLYRVLLMPSLKSCDLKSCDLGCVEVANEAATTAFCQAIATSSIESFA